VTIAEIRGKISDTGTNLSERMEDLLTSDVFGCMRYIPPHLALLPFLRTGHSIHGDTLAVPDRPVRVHYAFWPWISQAGRNPCEPDVVIGLETEGSQVEVVLVEAKYLSGISSDEDERPEPNDQLAREVDNLQGLSCATLHWDAHLRIRSRALLFVTQDLGIPRDSLDASLREYRSKRNAEAALYWTSWRHLPSILEASLEGPSSVQSSAAISDMLALLLRKDLVMFTGVQRVERHFSIPTFYSTPVASGYSWPVIPDPMQIKYSYEVSSHV